MSRRRFTIICFVGDLTFASTIGVLFVVWLITGILL